MFMRGRPNEWMHELPGRCCLCSRCFDCLRPLENAADPSYYLNLIVNAVIGGGVLLVINFVGGFWGFHIGVNPITALVVGLLGVPGVLLLIGLRLLFR